jgi:predicted enzyme related to lactoylglutathione lyase
MSNAGTIATGTAAITWFEIPTVDFDRARRFYGAILEIDLPESLFDGTRLAVFPYEHPGVGGCLDESSKSRPSADGTVVYLNVSGRLDRTLELVPLAGGSVAAPKEALPPGMGFVAHIIDSEGNRVGLHAIP